MCKYTRLIRYLKKQHVLSLCVTDGLHSWCANCFYVFDEEYMTFWLMTKLDTRHSQLMLHNPWVSGTINDQTKKIMLIKGVQYSGKIMLLSDSRERQARYVYQQRFEIIDDINVPLWEIMLKKIKMTDNTMEFGKKLVWKCKK